MTSRRSYLATLTAIGATSFAGCASGTFSPQSSNGNVSPAESDGAGSSGPSSRMKYHANLENHGYFDVSLDFEQLEKTWEFSEYESPSRSRSRPIVDDGTVYAPGAYAFYALDLADGSKQWRASLRDSKDGFERSKAGVSPAVAGESLVAGAAEDGTLYSMDLDTGSTNWTFDLGKGVDPPTVADGTVYVMTDADPSISFGKNQRSVYAIDFETGEKEWVFTEGLTDGCPAYANGSLFIGSVHENGDNDSLYRIDAASGEKVWRVKLGENTSSAPVTVGDAVFASTDTDLYAIEQADGSVRWRRPIGEHSPAYHDGVLYCVGGSVCYAIEHDSGDVLWEAELPGEDHGRPRVTRESVVLIDARLGRSFLALDRTDGQIVWTHEPPDFSFSLGLGADTVIVGYREGIYALSA